MPSPREIVPFAAPHIEQLTRLFNAHLEAVVPGFALPGTYLAARLVRDPGESVVDPWVVRRRTLVALERERVVAAVHLLRYGATVEVGPGYHDGGDVAWLVAWPSAENAAEAVLATGLNLLADWGADLLGVATGNLFVPSVSGIPDTWPHIATVLRSAGFAPDPERQEILHAGRIDHLEPPPSPPLEGLALTRRMCDYAPRFAAVLDGETIGVFDVGFDVTEGGALPALVGWADPWNLWVDERHRSQGVGSWLVRSTAPYLRLARCDRMLVTVAATEERNGAGRFYERLGLTRIATLQRAWTTHQPTRTNKETTDAGHSP
jgi:GNAT superfamily N-acetyltransferase